MKRLVAVLAIALSTAWVMPAQAHGMGGWRGGYGHMHHHHGGWRGDWVGPVLGAAIVGGAIYTASTPTYVTQPVYVAPPPPQRVAYYCASWGQYYPAVQTCPVPWQPVNY
ncbi:MAG: hypothetical protein RLZZ24_1035 [Pseudomonadota bacterium]|jgi:hypothetical protein